MLADVNNTTLRDLGRLFHSMVVLVRYHHCSVREATVYRNEIKEGYCCYPKQCVQPVHVRRQCTTR